MPTLSIQVWDPTGNRKQEVEVPDDAETDRLVAVLVDRLGLPDRGPDGQLLSYKLHHRRLGKQLAGSQTLHAAGVQPGDELRLLPEITAG